nr:transposase [uncultured Undibacterium sp.]
MKKKARCRHHTTLRGEVRTSSRSQKQAQGQTVPWLLAVSPNLGRLTAKMTVAIYSGRMQIEQTFRDIKNHRWGLGLSHSQTRMPNRLAILLLIGALACYALWLIALTVRESGYHYTYC